jgi:hypothetical protein
VGEFVDKKLSLKDAWCESPSERLKSTGTSTSALWCAV